MRAWHNAPGAPLWKISGLKKFSSSYLPGAFRSRRLGEVFAVGGERGPPHYGRFVPPGRSNRG